MSRPHTREGHTLQNLTNFTNIFVFGPLNLVFPPKCTGNRFPIAWPTCPYGWLWRNSPHITLLFLVGLAIYVVIFCRYKMFPSSHRSPEQLVPGVDTMASNNGRTCGKYRYSCSFVLLLAKRSCGSGVLLCLPGTAPDEPALVLFFLRERKINVIVM